MRARNLISAVLAIAFGAAAAQAEPLKIRLSYIVPVSNWATILFQRPELAPHDIGCFGLQVETVLVRNAAGQEDEDD